MKYKGKRTFSSFSFCFLHLNLWIFSNLLFIENIRHFKRFNLHFIRQSNENGCKIFPKQQAGNPKRHSSSRRDLFQFPALLNRRFSYFTCTVSAESEKKRLIPFCTPWLTLPKVRRIKRINIPNTTSILFSEALYSLHFFILIFFFYSYSCIYSYNPRFISQ